MQIKQQTAREIEEKRLNNIRKAQQFKNFILENRKNSNDNLIKKFKPSDKTQPYVVTIRSVTGITIPKVKLNVSIENSKIYTEFHLSLFYRCKEQDIDD